MPSTNMSVLIQGGQIVSSSGATPADVLITGETITAVIEPGSDMSESAARSSARIVDATGCYVVPGGVDVHTHLQLPMSPEATSSDSFASGTVAAAWGGTTTVIDFAGQMLGSEVRQVVEDRQAEAQGQCAIDYSFHLSMGDINERSLKEMKGIVDDGITSFKFFMAYPGAYYSDDGQLLQAMQQAGELGALSMMHAENGIAIDVLRDQAVKRGDIEPVWHGRTRPARLEGEAVHRASALAEVAEAPLYIVHLTSVEALEQVAWARDNGQNVFAETCPQYLYLSFEEHLNQPGMEGLRHVCSPPLRPASTHDHLWKGLRVNDLAVVSTDHCPFCDAEKKLGIDDFRPTPNGLGSLEHRMDLIFQGVVAGELSLARWVDTCSTTPARLFGLYPRKGVLAPGSDADVVIYDPAVEHTLGVATHHMNIDNSVWEGMAVRGQVRTVFSRGSVVLDNRNFNGRAGHGQFLARSLSDVLL